MRETTPTGTATACAWVYGGTGPVCHVVGQEYMDSKRGRCSTWGRARAACLAAGMATTVREGSARGRAAPLGGGPAAGLAGGWSPCRRVHEMLDMGSAGPWTPNRPVALGTEGHACEAGLTIITRRKPVPLHVRTRGDQHKKRRKKMARQWPKRPQVPFCHKECNAKTTRGWDTDK